jgi:coenzyme F420 biosynthesis associated uncharacterized protein
VTAADDLIDWDLAVATGTRLVRPGPQVTPEVARAVVHELRVHAGAAQGHVRDYTGLVAPTDGGAVAVIDRGGWVRANAEGFRTILAPLLTKLADRRADLPASSVVNAIGSRVTAIETGSLLAFLASKVLGPNELFPPYQPAHTGRDNGRRSAASPPAPPAPGRLLLVAPNVVSAEREMGVDPRDFRLWVCLHEETHRVQFGAVPWLRGHLLSEIRSYLDETELDPLAVLRRLGAAAGSVADAVRGAGEGSLLDAVQTPRQREILDRLTAVMSLLEGHADFVMDGVGPAVVPTVAEIRAKFQQRRTEVSRPEQVLRRLLGLEAKLRQYRDGERFVRGVVERIGMEGFNRVWESPETLPRTAELTDPDAWVARVGALPRGPQPPG